MTHPNDRIAPWHKESYDRFVNTGLPQLLSERLPLEAYAVTEDGPDTCALALALAGGSGTVHIRVDDVPRPDDTGVFRIDGTEVVVTPIASDERLDQAEIRCVGEQLYEFVEPRVGEAPPDLVWDEALAESWLPLGRWVREFLEPRAGARGTGSSSVRPLDGPNWLARAEHIRRIDIAGVRALGAQPGDDSRAVAPGQLGRVCPFMKPEGPNLPVVRFVARGATIRDGRLVVKDDRPDMRLSMTAASIPFLAHNDTNRALMGANMMRQWLVPTEPEPALVQTGNEPDSPGLWCGRNLLTAFVSWGGDTYEDGILVSKSCAQRLSFDAPLEPGDKLSNRHGTKGVVSRIVPDDQMPHLPDGTPVELVFSFIGLHARMNFGQLREAVAGRIARAEGRPFIAPPFHGPSADELRARLAKAGLPEDGMETLRDGPDGAPLARPSTVGYVYWGLTCHVARSKLRTFSDGPCCRQGQFEYYALRDVGAFATIAETFNTRSSDQADAGSLVERVTSGEEFGRPNTPTPAFRDLCCRLSAGGVRARLEDGRLRLSLAEPDADILPLAIPVRHPWLSEHSLSVVGRLPDLPEFAPVAEASARIERALAGQAPESLTSRARTNLQQHTDALFGALVTPEHVRPGNLVLFSARTVIAPGPEMSHEQVGLAADIAWGLFGPLVARGLGALEPVAERTTDAAERLDELMARSWVIVNRAPTTSPASILAFRPVRIPGRVIRLPLVACSLLNADFDGDLVAVFLPITTAGQREAGAKLSVAAHLDREPALLDLLSPQNDAMWGLAAHSLDEQGRRELAELVGEDVVVGRTLATRDSLRQALQRILQRQGAARTLAILDQLVGLGLEEAKASGASLAPFAGASLPEAVRPAPLTVDGWLGQLDDLADRFVVRTDYAAADVGPQLLAVKSGARGNTSQIAAGLTGDVIVDLDRELLFIPHGLIDGYEPHELFTRTVGGHEGLRRTVMRCMQLGRETRKNHEPKGFNVLARAMRSRRPGAVLARAAAQEEADPLTDLDARLFVGLLPD